MTATASLLSDDLLRQFAERAPVYDRENRFFSDPDLQNEGTAAGTKFGRSARLPRQDMEALS